MIRDLVELGGYEAIVTRNGDEAKAMLRRRQLPELVVANLSLPRLDGFALLAELRRISGPTGPPVVVVSASKELSGAAWNLKERLGVTEILAADATESQALETLALALPALRHPGSALDKPLASGVAHERWISETIDRYIADVARRFNVGVALASVTVGGQEWFRMHVNQPRRALSQGRSLRDWSFIRQVLEGNEAIVVPDVQQHPVFAQTEFPPAGTLRGYAGVPLFATSGRVAGAMCLFDLEPLSLDARALDALTEIGRRLALELDSSLERADSQERFSALSRLALTDQVTGLANRRGGEEALAREVSRTRRSGSPLSLVLFDIDRFKRINDESGHAIGDRVLRGISDILSASQRGSDLAMRWGGEEFLVLLPDVGLTGARIFAERVRENVQNLVIQDAGRITVSAGVSELNGDEDPGVALARADANLYRAKAAGRNRVEADHTLVTRCRWVSSTSPWFSERASIDSCAPLLLRTRRSAQSW
jgi:diguanylate cyclase (GGDEF)-like protein